MCSKILFGEIKNKKFARFLVYLRETVKRETQSNESDTPPAHFQSNHSKEKGLCVRSQVKGEPNNTKEFSSEIMTSFLMGSEIIENLERKLQIQY